MCRSIILHFRSSVKENKCWSLLFGNCHQILLLFDRKLRSDDGAVVRNGFGGRSSHDEGDVRQFERTARCFEAANGGLGKDEVGTIGENGLHGRTIGAASRVNRTSYWWNWRNCSDDWWTEKLSYIRFTSDSNNLRWRRLRRKTEPVFTRGIVDCDVNEQLVV